jgi:hypothetical protein
LRFEYDFLRLIDVEPVEVTSDGGLLPIRQFDEGLGWPIANVGR